MRWAITMVMAGTCWLAAVQGRALGQESPGNVLGRQPPLPTEADVMRVLATNRPRHTAAAVPVMDAMGGARFVFGATLPSVVCTPLQLCDIELQAGEVVQGMHIGDQARWTLEAAVTGAGPDAVHHVIVRPSDAGIRTLLVVTTDRRTYRIGLVSDQERFMPSVSFSYPQDPQDLVAQLYRLSGPRTAGAAPPASSAVSQRGSLAALSFAYALEGDEPAWKPVRVFNDGLQTVIELPFAVRQTEAPTLLVVRAEGGLFTDDEVVQVNYRVEGTRYVIDTVFDVADLIAGIGSAQQKVRIRRTR